MSPWFRIAGYVGGGILLVVLLVVGGAYGFSSRDLNATYTVDVEPLTVSASMDEAALLERGEHVTWTRGCMECHAEDGGGREFANNPAFGLLWTSNLTAGEGGIGGVYTDEDWDRAVRHGVGPNGKPLVFMPSHEFWPLSDDDMAAIIAYFRALPPVDRVPPAARPGPMARLLYVTGQMHLVPAKLIDHGASRPAAPSEAPTAEYGRYLATGCTGCHNASFSGGKIAGGDPAWPEAANLTSDATGLAGWSLADFTRALREGIRPDGSEIDPAMPVEFTSRMTDTEIEAVYTYLMSLEPKAFGEI